MVIISSYDEEYFFTQILLEINLYKTLLIN